MVPSMVCVAARGKLGILGLDYRVQAPALAHRSEGRYQRIHVIAAATTARHLSPVPDSCEPNHGCYVVGWRILKLYRKMLTSVLFQRNPRSCSHMDAANLRLPLHRYQIVPATLLG